MNSIVTVAAVAVAVGVAFAVFATPLQKDQLKSITAFAAKDRRCFNLVKPLWLGNPDTAYLASDKESFEYADSEYTTRGTHRRQKVDKALRVYAYAQNAMGAYQQIHVSCILTKDGDIDKSATEIALLLAQRYDFEEFPF